jgi:ribonuclease III
MTIEPLLGYTFKDPQILRRALTHRSFHGEHNERLEFLGDSVLNCIIATLLFDAFPAMPEGDLSRLRASLVNQSSLAEIAERLKLSQVIRLGDGELKSGGHSRPSILADTVEALIGAVYLDGGFAPAVEVVRKLFASKIESNASIQPAKDPKTALQELMQANRMPLPEYRLDRIEGEAHSQTFFITCVLESIQAEGTGVGLSRRAAEQEAAGRALEIALTKVKRRRR